MNEKPQIYCFHNALPDSDGVAFAMHEDGRVLASHFCSNAGFARLDLGCLDGHDWSNKREAYAAACPDGYELVFVDDVKNDPRLAAAYQNNQARRTPPAAESAE